MTVASPDAASIAPKPGDFIVKKGRWDYAALGPVAKVTAQQVHHPDRYATSRLARCHIEDVLFSGDEPSARALAERLGSSAALRREEHNAADRRHDERVRKHVAAAIIASGEGE